MFGTCKQLFFYNENEYTFVEVIILLTMKDIRREGDPILREVAKKVNLPLSTEDRKTMDLMLQFLKNSQDPEIGPKYDLRPGVGIAAPQIGMSKRMFAVHCEDDDGKQVSMGVINPVLVKHSESTIFIPGGEGCLSVDRVVEGIVPRYEKITVQAFNVDGEEMELNLSGFVSIVFQHEMDHLDGIMFYDRIEG